MPNFVMVYSDFYRNSICWRVMGKQQSPYRKSRVAKWCGLKVWRATAVK